MTDTKSILEGPKGRDIDVQGALDLLPFWTRARIGFVRGTVMYDRDYVKFQVSCGPRPRQWLIIKLAADDTFSLEFGRLRKFDWTVKAQAEGVYVDSLATVVEAMFQEAYA